MYDNQERVAMNNLTEITYPYHIRALEDIGPAIRQARKKKRWTQQDLADWTATSTKFISNVECGKETVRLDKVFELLVVLDLRIYLSNGSLFLEY